MFQIELFLCRIYCVYPLSFHQLRCFKLSYSYVEFIMFIFMQYEGSKYEYNKLKLPLMSLD
jgi:hypothetical protein